MTGQKCLCSCLSKILCEGRGSTLCASVVPTEWDVLSLEDHVTFISNISIIEANKPSDESGAPTDSIVRYVFNEYLNKYQKNNGAQSILDGGVVLWGSVTRLFPPASITMNKWSASCWFSGAPTGGLCICLSVLESSGIIRLTGSTDHKNT